MNYLFVSVVVACVGAQLIKIALMMLEGKKVMWYDLIVTGGMPSSHAALVTSLATGIYLIEGLTPLFLLSAALAIIVMRDAFGVRLTAGKEGDLLRKLLRKHHMNAEFPQSYGHTPPEVFVGFLIGLLSTMIIFLLW